MNRLTDVIRRESTLTLVREALWRTQKRWKRMRFLAEVERPHCPVQYRAVGYYRPRLEEASESAQQAVLAYADLVSRGNFLWFGYRPVSLGIPPRWHFDFVSGVEWPQEPADSVTVVRHDGSDVKVPWELSRLQFLPVLGKAFVLTREERYRELAKMLLSDWIASNPIGIGVNWTTAMEAGLRGMSICFLLDLLAPFPQYEQPWLGTVTRSLWEHLLFIEAHNEFSHFARSNHYLSNIVGLLCLSTYLSGPGMDLRRRRFSDQVQREMLHQVHEDGGDYEASTGYHVLIAQMFTSSLLLLRAQGIEPSRAFEERLRGMYRMVAALTDSRGRIPHVGDCDDGRVELLADDLEQMTASNLDERDSLTLSSLLGVGECILGENFGGRGDDKFWYGQRKEGASQARAAEISTMQILPLTGIAAARRGKAELVFFVMANGIDGKGSHTHNDKLSVILRIDGQDFLTDCGTCCYSRNAARRNFFRSTLAHNTVRVDGEEQNRFSECGTMLFRMQNDVRVSAIQSEEAGTFTQFSARHHGYARLGVVHTRTVSIHDTSNAIIEDAFTGTGTHSVEATWHFPQTWRLSPVRDRGLEVECMIRGPRSVQMKFSSTADLTLQCAHAKISRAYGLMSDATTVTVGACSTLPLQLATIISWGNR